MMMMFSDSVWITSPGGLKLPILHLGSWCYRYVTIPSFKITLFYHSLMYPRVVLILYILKDDLELLIRLPQPLKCWD